MNNNYFGIGFFLGCAFSAIILITFAAAGYPDGEPLNNQEIIEAAMACDSIDTHVQFKKGKKGLVGWECENG